MKPIKILSFLIIIIGFSQCASLKFEKKPPFKITNAVYKNWVGGQPGVSGINVKITYSSAQKIQFDSIYFLNKAAKLEAKDVNKNTEVYGYFYISSLNNDIILDSDPTKEMNNPIPKIKNFPFELKENEAVISYTIKGNTKYYKIKSLVKQNSINFK